MSLCPALPKLLVHDYRFQREGSYFSGSSAGAAVIATPKTWLTIPKYEGVAPAKDGSAADASGDWGQHWIPADEAGGSQLQKHATLNAGAATYDNPRALCAIKVLHKDVSTVPHSLVVKATCRWPQVSHFAVKSAYKLKHFIRL